MPNPSFVRRICETRRTNEKLGYLVMLSQLTKAGNSQHALEQLFVSAVDAASDRQRVLPLAVSVCFSIITDYNTLDSPTAV